MVFKFRIDVSKIHRVKRFKLGNNLSAINKLITRSKYNLSTHASQFLASFSPCHSMRLKYQVNYLWLNGRTKFLN